MNTVTLIQKWLNVIINILNEESKMEDNQHILDFVELMRDDFESEADLIKFVNNWIENNAMPNIEDYINE